MQNIDSNCSKNYTMTKIKCSIQGFHLYGQCISTSFILCPNILIFQRIMKMYSRNRQQANNMILVLLVKTEQLTLQVLLAETELLTLQEHLSSHSFFTGFVLHNFQFLSSILSTIVFHFDFFLWPWNCHLSHFDLWLLMYNFGNFKLFIQHQQSCMT